MSLRPKRAQWFEVVVRKDDCSPTTEALAGTAQVQFECAGERSAKELFAELREPLDNYRTLLPAYRDWWPEPVFDDRCCVLPMESSAKFAMGRLQVWQRRAQPRLDELRALEASRADFLLWQRILDHLSDSQLDLGALSESGPLLTGLCLLLPSTAEPASFAQLLSVTVPLGEQRAVLAAVRQQDAELLCRQAEALHGRCLSIPKWFEGTAQQCRSRLDERVAALEQNIGQVTGDLRDLAERSGVARALGMLQRLDWLISHAHNLALTEEFCWITGWTTAADESVLNRALADAGVAASVQFLDAPEHVRSPSLFNNPAWARPFEVFTRAMGMPAADEADPSTWVAVLVPLMFGYMCGDVGHGLVIALAGLALQRHWPLARLLVFCGVAATGFGFLYGDLFGLEDVLSPLWLRPLDHPLLALAVPLAGGAVVLTLGLLLNSVQLCWLSGQRLAWVADIAQLCVYWGIVLAFYQPALILLSLVGVVLCAVYKVWIERSGVAALSSLGELVENTVQLLLNTLSFVRIGAFALAHAGLSSAVFGLADGLSSSTAHLTVMILGNAVIIVLEGLVVSIQATRLVLFEFFVRFFRGQGRVFEPAHSPPSVARGHHHEH
jgi:V/A-type H+-transporting ATPase subunit I